MAGTAQRYNTVAIILHWVMALGFFMMLGSGIAMSYFDLEQSLKFNLYQWHKSGGVILLIAFALRITWRLITYKSIPALPESFPKLEKLAAHLGHYGLYAMMLLMPISGWIIVSSSVYGLPTIVFNLFEWPHIPGLQGNERIHEASELAHLVLAIIFGLLITGHIAAVIKHAVIDHENLLTRMWWTKEKIK